MRHRSSWLAAVGIFLMAAALTLGWATPGEAQRRVSQTGQTTCYQIERYPLGHPLEGDPVVRDADNNPEFVDVNGLAEPNPVFSADTGVLQDTALASCAGTGQDGEFQAGYKSAFIDKGGRIRDKKTGLVWAKKSDDATELVPSIHDKDNTYTWEEALAHVRLLNNICHNDQRLDGQGVPLFGCATDADCKNAVRADLTKVGGKCGFCGKRDWRLPNVKELGTLLNVGIFTNPLVPTPTIDPIFNTNCVPGVTVLTGSCTHSDDLSNDLDNNILSGVYGLAAVDPLAALRVPMTYWSSTSGDAPGDAWFVDFFTGDSGAHFKDADLDIDATALGPVDPSNPFINTEVIFAGHVRAVRGGLKANPNPDPADDD